MKLNKKGSISVIIIIILSILLVGALGYIVYDKVIKVEEVETNKPEEKVVDVTNEAFVKTLHESLITQDKTFGLYFQEKISIEDTTNPNFVLFNVKNNLLENNIDIHQQPGFRCGIPNDEDSRSAAIPYEIDKSKINKYIQNKYNTNLTYDFTGSLNFYRSTEMIESSENVYKIYCVAKGGGIYYITHSLIKAEQEGNKLYIYDKAVFCDGDGSATECRISIDSKDAIVEVDHSGYQQEPFNIETYAEEQLNRVIDQLSTTYKHTFEKVNGNYYWISSEMKIA